MRLNYCFSLVFSLRSVASFQAPKPTFQSFALSRLTLLEATPNGVDMERMKGIMEQESLNAESLKASAEAMKNMKPSDIDQILAEMDNMPASQLEQLKSMGMDPAVMKSSLQMMKKNPEMMKTMGEMMGTMTPEELLKQSRQAQETMKSLGDTNVAAASAFPVITDAQIVEADEEEKVNEEDQDDAEPIEPSEKVLGTMFQAAELMSEPPTGGVTFAGFCTVPPVAVLAAGNGEDDLSNNELTECWNKGSLGATRVDKAGFKRVWMEVQESKHRYLRYFL
jgi:ribosomal protein L12E/L44/L45/RPP1/RPP2